MGKAKIGNAIEEKNRAIEKAVRAMFDKPQDVTERERAEEIQQQAAEIRARARPEGRYTISEAMILLRYETGVFYNIQQAVEKDEIPGFTDETGNRMQNPVSWVCWDDLNKWMEKNTHIKFRFPAPATPAAKVEAVQSTTPGDDDWTDKALKIANRIALEKYAGGQREITARNISDAVAIELAKDSKTHGIRGERSAGNIRNIALKGWKFIPPTGTNGTSGTKK